MSDTGTIYGLTDPRDGQLRYIGQTVQSLPQRLSGHLAATRSSPRVRAWIGELRAAGLRPEIGAIREAVPAADLNAAETAEITRILVAGGELLNALATAPARKMLERMRQEKLAADRVKGWADLAAAAVAVIGGPVPPGDLPCTEGPDASLWLPTRAAWGRVRRHGPDSFDHHLGGILADAAATPSSSRADTSRHLTLSVWYMAAVTPWRHLADLGALPLDDASFIEFAGCDAGTRDALEFLASRAIHQVPSGSRHSPVWTFLFQPSGSVSSAPSHAIAARTAARKDAGPVPA